MRVSIQRAIAEATPLQMKMRVDPLLGFDPSPDVVILAASRDWILATTIDGFSLSGYVAVEREHVASLDTSKYLLFRKRIALLERSWPKKLLIPEIDLTNASTILRDLQGLEKYAIVLCETRVNWRSIHCRIVKITPKQATLWGFDALGKWEGRPKRFDVTDITQIRFGSQYLDLYQKHSQ